MRYLWITMALLLLANCSDFSSNAAGSKKKNFRTQNTSYLEADIRAESFALLSTEIIQITSARVAVQTAESFFSDIPIYCNNMRDVITTDVSENIVRVPIPDSCVDQGFQLFIVDIVAFNGNGTPVSVSQNPEDSKFRYFLDFKEGSWSIRQFEAVSSGATSVGTGRIEKNSVSSAISFERESYCDESSLAVAYEVQVDGKLAVTLSVRAEESLIRAKDNGAKLSFLSSVDSEFKYIQPLVAGEWRGELANGIISWTHLNLLTKNDQFDFGISVRLSDVLVCNYQFTYYLN